MDALEFIRVRELDVAVRIWNPKATRTLIAWHGLARHGGDFAALARELGNEWRIIAKGGAVRMPISAAAKKLVLQKLG